MLNKPSQAEPSLASDPVGTDSSTLSQTATPLSSSSVSQPPQIPDHELLKKIGGGSYGEVWLARNVMGTLRAVKIVQRQNFERAEHFEREFKGIQKFEPISRTHDGLVDILQIGRNDHEGYFYYVMELADATAQRRNGVLESWSDATSGRTQHSTAPPLQHSNSYTPRTLHSDLKTRRRLPTSECVSIGLALTIGNRSEPPYVGCYKSQRGFRRGAKNDTRGACAPVHRIQRNPAQSL